MEDIVDTSMERLSREPDQNRERYKMLAEQTLSLLFYEDESVELDGIVDKTAFIDRREAKSVLRVQMRNNNVRTTPMNFNYMLTSGKEKELEEVKA